MKSSVIAIKKNHAKHFYCVYEYFVYGENTLQFKRKVGKYSRSSVIAC